MQENAKSCRHLPLEIADLCYFHQYQALFWPLSKQEGVVFNVDCPTWSHRWLVLFYFGIKHGEQLFFRQRTGTAPRKRSLTLTKQTMNTMHKSVLDSDLPKCRFTLSIPRTIFLKKSFHCFVCGCGFSLPSALSVSRQLFA